MGAYTGVGACSGQYGTIRSTFMEDLDKLLGGSFEEFSALNTFERTGFVLGCENWERYDFKALLSHH